MKKIFVTFLLLITGFLLVGCKKKYPEGSEAANKKIVLSLWTTAEKDYFEALGREFLSALQNPNVSFKVNVFKDDAELHYFLLDKMSEGEGPDIIYTNGNWITRNIKKLAAIENDESFTISNFKNTFVRSAYDTLIQEEKIWGVPMGVDSLALIYNDEHITERLRDRNMPGKTWELVQEDVETLTKTDNSFTRFANSGIALGRLDNINYGFEILENIMMQMGTKFFSEDQTEVLFHKTKEFSNFGKSENLGAAALNFFTGFADDKFKHFSWNLHLANADSEMKNFEPFLLGNLSMVFGYSKDLKNLENWRKELEKKGNRTISEKNIRVTFFPQMKEIGSKKIIGKIYALAVPKSSKNNDLAWRFLKFAVRKENLKDFFKETNLPTARLELLQEQSDQAHIGIFVLQSKYSQANISPISKESFKDEFSKLILQINERKISVERGLESLGNRLNDELKSYWLRKKELSK